MARKSTGTQVGKAIQVAIDGELEEIRRKNDDGKFVYSLMDRTRVYDRALKLEALKLKADDPEWGTGYGKPKGGSGENGN